MTDRSSPGAPSIDRAIPRLVIVQDCAPGPQWTTDIVDSIMCHVNVGDLTNMQRGVAITTNQLHFDQIRSREFRSAWNDWVSRYNGDQKHIRILIQDAHSPHRYQLFGPPGAALIFEITVFDKNFFGLGGSPFRQESCGQQLLRWDAFFTTIFPGCETTLTTGQNLAEWLTHSVALTEQHPRQQEVVLLRGSHEVTHHRLFAPISAAC